MFVVCGVAYGRKCCPGDTFCVLFGPRFAVDGVAAVAEWYRREARLSPFLSIGWRYLASVSPERYCGRASPAVNEWRVYPLDPRPNAVGL
ncbi:hypothetical protein TNCV_2127431 [Trichonephila clavipes]|nr:hypothetical protein TNCV_2127431 [Trichonephila clavipes]